MSEIVYAFTNVAMPGLIKIGMTSWVNLTKRLEDLSKPSGIPAPFECLYAAEVDNAKKAEKVLHAVFYKERLNEKREFFKMDEKRVLALLELIDKSKGKVTATVQGKLDANTTPEERQAINAEKNRRDRFTFSELKIRKGAELVYAYDARKKCKVVDDRHVEYKGKKDYTLSGLAGKFLQDEGLPTGRGVNGTLYFLYKGELLNDRRNKLETGK